MATAGTLFVALYGESVPYAWLHPAPDLDAFALFHQRSLAMGWLDDRLAGGGLEDRLRRAPGLWAMNDAGWHHPMVPAEAGLLSWFQVEASAVADDRPLPVRPFLHCAEEVTRRVGQLRLTAMQILLPVSGIDPAARPPYAPVPSMLATGWLAGGDPGARTRVEVHIDGGRDPAFPALVGGLADHLRRLDQEVFRVRSVASTGPERIPAPFDDSFWNGPSEHRLLLRGDLAAWSVDAIGWLAEVVADCAAALGVRVPLLLTLVGGGAVEEPEGASGAPDPGGR